MARARFGLEVFKFALYVSIPIGLSWLVIGDTEVLNAIVRNRSYVVYPPEGPRPPTAEQLQELYAKTKAKQAAQKAKE